MALTKMGALRVVDPEKWARKVRLVIRFAGVTKAAPLLGVSIRTCRNWARELGFPAETPGPRATEEKK